MNKIGIITEYYKGQWNIDLTTQSYFFPAGYDIYSNKIGTTYTFWQPNKCYITSIMAQLDDLKT